MDGIDGWVQFDEPTHFIPKEPQESEDKSVSAILDEMKSIVDRMIDDGLKMIEKRRERINENT